MIACVQQTKIEKTVMLTTNTERMVLDRRTLGSIDEWLEQARTVGAIALIDKEETWTSFDCVAKVRNMSRIKRVGHAGTLDPLATGLLVLCFGKATKDIASLQDDIKVYDVDILLGATSTTDDRGGEVEQHVCEPADNDAVTNTLEQFLGVIQQTPPAFSAVRHQGKRQYDLAREGKEFTPKVREVTVHSITDVVVQWPHVQCRITCSKGTYIRSIARDLGQALGCGGYVWTLRRVRSGGFAVDAALTVGEIRDALTKDALPNEAAS